MSLVLTADPIARERSQAATTPRLAQLTNVVKSYGGHVALDGLNLEIRSGEILVLLGPNGAGKSTAIKLLTGLRSADSGSVRLFGDDPRTTKTRRELGVTPQNVDFPPMLGVTEIIDLVRAHYDHPLGTEELIQMFELGAQRKRSAGGLSGGQARRLAVAAAFAGAPKLAVLDEPTTGLDVESRRAVWRAIRGYVAGGGTVLLTTHYLEEAEALATRIIVMHHGRSFFEGSVEQIKSRLGIKRIIVHGDVSAPIGDVLEVQRENERSILRTKNVDGVIEALLQRGVRFDDIEIAPVSLEEAFLDLTGAAL
jgi:ABC-2 type transport system ATP-binding protein